MEWTKIEDLNDAPSNLRVPVPPARQARRGLSARAFALLLCVACTMSPAQNAAPIAQQAPTETSSTEQVLSSYEGQNVSSIEVAGRPDVNPSQYTGLFVQKPGQPFSKDKIDQSVAALKKSIASEAVRVQVEPEADGVRVLIILEPAVYFGIFQFPGAERFAYSRLIQVADFPTQTPFSAAAVEQDTQSLVNFFRQQGYFEAEVKPEVKVDSEHALANVFFAVTLNRCAKFGAIDIGGATPEQTAQLNHSLQTFIASVRGASIRPGHTYHYSNLTKAAQYMQTRFEKQARLGAQVKLAGAEYHADTNRADIHFDVDAGPSTNVEVEGAHLFSWTRKSLLPIYQGIPVDDESVQEGRQALESFFQAKGFFDVHVDAQFKKDPSGNSVLYRIAKEKKHKVEDVKLSGNASLSESELTPHIAVQQSHLFSPGKFSDRLVRTSVKNLTAVYESEGFSSVKVVPAVSNRGDNLTVSFRVIEGPRDIVNSLRIVGADTFPQSKFAPKGLKLAAGQPYSQAHIAEDRTTVVANYLEAGYLNSSFRESATQVSKKDPHRIDVVYHINEGPKVSAGNILTLGRAHTQQRLINEDVSDIKTGHPLTEADLLTAGSKLYDHTGVFDWAEVDPKRDITTQTSEDVLVKVHEARRNEFTYGFGFEVINRGGSVPSGTVALPGLPPVGLPSNFRTSQVTFYGPRGTVQYTRNNLRGQGESLSLTAFAGRLDQRAAAYYIDPRFRWSSWKVTTSVSAERDEENPIFSAQEELATLQFQHPIDKSGKDTLFLRYSFSQTNLTRIEIPDLVPTLDRNVRLSTLAANITRDTRDNPLDEHKGVLDSIELDFNSTKLGSSVDFVKLTAQTAYYKQAIHNIVWAGSLRIGLAQPYDNSRVPLSQQFFTGGGNSLRGFPLDGAGPQRPVEICSDGATSNCPEIQVPSGGNELLLINLESRIPLSFKKGLGLVVFYDGGNVFPRIGFHDFASIYSNNVGLGLRYATPVGPIRFDVGQNLNPIPGIKATQYFVSIGQAF